MQLLVCKGRFPWQKCGYSNRSLLGQRTQDYMLTETKVCRSCSELVEVGVAFAGLPMLGRLTVADGPQAGRSFPIYDGVTVGRLRTAEGGTNKAFILLDDIHVSRLHASLERLAGDNVQLTSLNPTNPIILDSQVLPLNGIARLRGGERLEMGKTLLLFETAQGFRTGTKPDPKDLGCCPLCGGKNVVPWEKRRCPKCGGRMIQETHRF